MGHKNGSNSIFRSAFSIRGKPLDWLFESMSNSYSYWWFKISIMFRPCYS